MKKRILSLAAALCLAVSGLLVGCQAQIITEPQSAPPQSTAAGSGTQAEAFSLDTLPEYSGSAWVEVNGNQPYFTAEDLTQEPFERYSPLDSLGRCGEAYANICLELMPTEKRGEIGSVKPTGWHSVRYDCVDGKSLYNRCHLIGFQLAGENANRQNLITGTRYLNVIGMLPFENLVADYVKETQNHVLYRVTPVFRGNDLVAQGVLMEGWSVEDDGDGVAFCVFAYNVQPQIWIDYATGESGLEDTRKPAQQETATYILNQKSKKFHRPDCSGAEKISADNRSEFSGSRQELIDQGYEPCGICKP